MNIVLPVVAGVIIYWQFRKDTYISVWLDKWSVLHIKWNLEWLPGCIQQFACSYCCDILWAYALVFAVDFFQGTGRHHIWKSLIETVFFVSLMEMMQLWDFIGGTFDVWDIVFEMVALILGAVILYQIHKGKEVLVK